MLVKICSLDRTFKPRVAGAAMQELALNFQPHLDASSPAFSEVAQPHDSSIDLVIAGRSCSGPFGFVELRASCVAPSLCESHTPLSVSSTCRCHARGVQAGHLLSCRGRDTTTSRRCQQSSRRLSRSSWRSREMKSRSRVTCWRCGSGRVLQRLPREVSCRSRERPRCRLAGLWMGSGVGRRYTHGRRRWRGRRRRGRTKDC